MFRDRPLLVCVALSALLHVLAFAGIPELQEGVRRLPTVQKLTRIPIKFVKIIVPKPKPKPKPQVIAQRPRRVYRRVRRVRRVYHRPPRQVEEPKPEVTPEQPQPQEPVEPAPIAELLPPPETEAEKPKDLPPPAPEVAPAPEPQREMIAAAPKPQPRVDVVAPAAPAPEDAPQPVQPQEPVAQAPIPETQIAMAPAPGVPTAAPTEEPKQPERPLAAAAPTPKRAADIGASGGVEKKTPEIGAPLDTKVEQSTTPKPGVGGPPLGEMKPQAVRVAALPRGATKVVLIGREIPAGPTGPGAGSAVPGPRGPEGAPGSAPAGKATPRIGDIDLATGQPAKAGAPGGQGPPAPWAADEASPRPLFTYRTETVIAMAPVGGRGAGGGEGGEGGSAPFAGAGAGAPGGGPGGGGPGGQGWGTGKARPGFGGGWGEFGPGEGGGGPGGGGAGPGGGEGGPGWGGGPVAVGQGGPGGGVGFPGGTGTGIGGEPEGWGIGAPGEAFAMAPSGGEGGGFGGNEPGGPTPGSGTPWYKRLPQIGWPFGFLEGEPPGPGIPGGTGEGPPATRETGPINLASLLAPLASPIGVAAGKLADYLAPSEGDGGGGFGGTGPGDAPAGGRQIGFGKTKPGGLYTDISGGFDMPLGVTTSDYDTDAAGTRNLMQEIRNRTNLSVTVQERFQDLTYESIKSLPVVHLRGHKAFKLTPQEREALRKYVENGGTIVGESSHGPFDQCFEREMKQIFGKGFEDLGLDHEVYKSYYVLKDYPPGDMGERHPLQAIKAGGRPAVIYSRNDYGDAWEGTGEWIDPRVREPAFQMGVNIYVYIMAHWQKTQQAKGQ
jgi:hypothetical protein